VVEVLEYIVNDAARRMLRKLAEGAPAALGTGLRPPPVRRVCPDGGPAEPGRRVYYFL
jgi:hypothetical protein